ncbi:hypothetical protein BVC93_00185 [Mycobacterium sp. MS1601]|uniref:hypothetical protein n=1 Tax=Mycobacterium sp. MS1601 TaxID=1936029 RepID=UPI0009790FBA|nr:hypothetical protein [Mycobacterium sp. MS1601]AQA01092.1 hypothetical protein BVC93_00185 [Mycobacterium sp. MS1601]
MELTWWPVTLLGVAALIVVAAVVWAAPFRTDRSHVRPLANVARLTALPEYVRAYRIYVASMMVALVLLVVTFAAAVVAGARPTGLPEATQAFDAAYPQDTMLCVGQDVTDPVSAQFLSYYAQLAESYDRQRLGLTSATLRVIPLTRDHTYVTDRLEGLARLAPIQQGLDGGTPVSAAERGELSARAAEFSRTLDYTDYTRSVEDVLALCLGGFTGDVDAPRRQLIYLGPSSLRTASDTRPSLFSGEAVAQLARDADVQINVVARADVVNSAQDSDSLRALAQESGGVFQLYNPPDAGGPDPVLTQHLDDIRNNPPAVVRPDAVVVTSASWDTPQPALIAAVVAAILLSVTLVVLRR